MVGFVHPLPQPTFPSPPPFMQLSIVDRMLASCCPSRHVCWIPHVIFMILFNSRPEGNMPKVGSFPEPQLQLNSPISEWPEIWHEKGQTTNNNHCFFHHQDANLWRILNFNWICRRCVIFRILATSKMTFKYCPRDRTWHDFVKAGKSHCTCRNIQRLASVGCWYIADASEIPRPTTVLDVF